VTQLTPPLTTAAKDLPGGTSPLHYGWLLLPLYGVKRMRKKKRLLCLAALLIPVAMVLGLAGCGGGYFGQSATNYVVTVTATSGTISRSTTVTLMVQ
jgi:hypothetical protein